MHAHAEMENTTASSVILGCATHEDEPLWILAMIAVSAISTLLTVVLDRFRKRRARERAGDFERARPSPHLEREEEV